MRAAEVSVEVPMADPRSSRNRERRRGDPQKRSARCSRTRRRSPAPPTPRRFPRASRRSTWPGRNRRTRSGVSPAGSAATGSRRAAAGGFARLAEAKKQNAFEPLLCDARGVLDDGVLDIGDGAPAMTLSNLLAREPTRRRGGGGGASRSRRSRAPRGRRRRAAAKPAAKDAETKPSPCSAGPAAPGGARCDVDPDEDEMLAAMEAGGGDFDAAEARAAAGAARRRGRGGSNPRPSERRGGRFRRPSTRHLETLETRRQLGG